MNKIEPIRQLMITLIRAKCLRSPALQALVWLEQEWRSAVGVILRNKGFFSATPTNSAKFYSLAVMADPLNPHGWHNLGVITGSRECFEQEDLLLQNAATIDWCLKIAV